MQELEIVINQELTNNIEQYNPMMYEIPGRTKFTCN